MTTIASLKPLLETARSQPLARGPEIVQFRERCGVIFSGDQPYVASGVPRCDLLQPLLSKFLLRYVDRNQRLILRRSASTAVLIRWQVDRAGRVIHRERNHARNEKQQQAHGVECEDRPIYVAAWRLIAPLRVKNHPAARDQAQRTGRTYPKKTTP